MAADLGVDLTALIDEAEAMAKWIPTAQAEGEPAEYGKFRRQFAAFQETVRRVGGEHLHGLVNPYDPILLDEIAALLHWLSAKSERLHQPLTRNEFRAKLRRLGRILKLHRLAPADPSAPRDLRWLRQWIEPRLLHWSYIEWTGVAISHHSSWHNVVMRVRFGSSNAGCLPNGILQKTEDLMFYRQAITPAASVWHRFLAGDVVDFRISDFPAIVLESVPGGPYEEWSSVRVGQVEPGFLGPSWWGASALRVAKDEALTPVPGKNIWELNQRFSVTGAYGGLDRALAHIGFDLQALLSSKCVVRLFAPLEATIESCTHSASPGLVRVAVTTAPKFTWEKLFVALEPRRESGDVDLSRDGQRAKLTVGPEDHRGRHLRAEFTVTPGDYVVKLAHEEEGVLQEHFIEVPAGTPPPTPPVAAPGASAPDDGDALEGAMPDRAVEQAPQASNPRRVFIIQGRHQYFTKSMVAFLHAVGLEPMEFEQLVQATGDPSGNIGDAVLKGLEDGQAIVALLTEDDVATLHPSRRGKREKAEETGWRLQPRLNVLLEVGAALAADRAAAKHRVILVRVGHTYVPSDLDGKHVLNFDGSAASKHKLVRRLRTAGCDPQTDDRSGWLEVEFPAGSPALPSLDPERVIGVRAKPDARRRRKPATGRARGLRPRK